MNSETRIDTDAQIETNQSSESVETLNESQTALNNEDQAEPMTADIPEQQRRYSSEEVADIIRISLQDEARRADDTVDYKELLAIASEMGVDSEQIARAVRLLEEEQAAHDKESLLWARFKSHSFLFIAVNLLCITINVLGSSTTFWSMYVLFGWGLFLLGHYAGLRYAPQFVEIAMERTRQMASNHYQALFDDDASIGFTETESSGMTETEGMISFEDGKLVIEYQTMDSLLGVFKSSIKVVEVPIHELVSIRLEQRLWNADLVLQGKSMRALRHVPGSSAGKVRLRINRQSARAALELANEVRSLLET